MPKVASEAVEWYTYMYQVSYTLFPVDTSHSFFNIWRTFGQWRWL